MSSGSSFSHSQPTEVDVSKCHYQSSSEESSESVVDNWDSNMDLVPGFNWKDTANWRSSYKKYTKQTKPFHSGQNTMNNADYLSASDIAWLDSIVIDEGAVNRKVKKLQYIMKDGFKKEYEIAWLLRAVTCIDLTTLSGDDTDYNVQRLCYKGVRPLSEHLVNLFKEKLDYKEVEEIATAAICVYPSRVSAAARVIKQFNLDGVINIASVATGFPSGQYPLATKLEEIKYCISQGATEIDIVISRELVIANKWKELYDEISQMRKACDNCHMKTILATGECGSLTNVYKASLIAMMAGSDFIKTSTGKETVNATLQVGVVMCRAISDYNTKTGRKVGLKPAGGIRTSHDALLWLVLVKEILGDFWLNSKFFRIGASGLLGDIEKRLFYLITGYTPSKEYFFTT